MRGSWKWEPNLVSSLPSLPTSSFHMLNMMQYQKVAFIDEYLFAFFCLNIILIRVWEQNIIRVRLSTLYKWSSECTVTVPPLFALSFLRRAKPKTLIWFVNLTSSTGSFYLSSSNSVWLLRKLSLQFWSKVSSRYLPMSARHITGFIISKTAWAWPFPPQNLLSFKNENS